jgi:hypothetical protein
MLTADAAKQFHSAHIGYPEIRNDKLGMPLIDDVLGFPVVSGLRNLVTGLLQSHPDNAPEADVAISDENKIAIHMDQPP